MKDENSIQEETDKTIEHLMKIIDIQHDVIYSLKGFIIIMIIKHIIVFYDIQPMI